MDCLFCKFVSGQIPVEFIYSTQTSVAFRDISPQAPTHILIVPKGHFPNAAELAMSAPSVAAELLTIAADLAESEGLTGYRLVFNTGESAGQSVFHAHLHLLGGREFAWPPG